MSEEEIGAINIGPQITEKAALDVNAELSKEGAWSSNQTQVQIWEDGGFAISQRGTGQTIVVTPQEAGIISRFLFRELPQNHIKHSPFAPLTFLTPLNSVNLGGQTMTSYATQGETEEVSANYPMRAVAVNG